VWIHGATLSHRCLLYLSPKLPTWKTFFPFSIL
jgi:hypothetical protein